ncbi:MAG: APC family permease [Caulobacteraceae bacterium]
MPVAQHWRFHRELDVIKQAGTGVFVCFVAAAVLGLAMAAVYGELASAFPQTGGEYTILGRALGPAWGVAVLSLNLLGFSIAQALSGVGVATYLVAVWPGLPVAPTAAVLVALVTATAVLDIKVNAVVTGASLGVELLALLLLTSLGFAHAHRGPVAALFTPAVAYAAGLARPSLAVLGAATAGAIYAFNGYGAVVFLGEEMREAPRRIARVVFLSLALAVITELAPLAGVLVGVPSLRELTSSAAPIPTAIVQLGGPALARAMSVAVALAIFNAMIAVALMAGRQLYSTGRDGLWPKPISQALAHVHPRLGSPWIATLAMGATSLAACLLNPQVLVLILGNGNVAIYAGLCLAALIGRRSGATSHTQFRMPLFPLPPLFGLILLAGVVAFDLIDPAGRRGLAATAAAVVLALLYYAIVLRKRAV